MTDRSRFCNYPRHRRINHAARIYVDGEVHTQTIEGFWSLVKNGIGGVYHSVSAKWLQSYLDEYAWRYNHREHTKRRTGEKRKPTGEASSGYYLLGLPFGSDGFASRLRLPMKSRRCGIGISNPVSVVCVGCPLRSLGLRAMPRFYARS